LQTEYLSTDDPDESIRFYSEALGMPLKLHTCVGESRGRCPVDPVECVEQLPEERAVCRRQRRRHHQSHTGHPNRAVVADQATQHVRLARCGEDVSPQRRQLCAAGTQRRMHRLKHDLQPELPL
jgi:catechol 2,3-dioxygenase-like lactoylglutathione lyase family enzyme